MPSSQFPFSHSVFLFCFVFILSNIMRLSQFPPLDLTNRSLMSQPESSLFLNFFFFLMFIMTRQTCDINNILIQSYLRDIVVWFQTTAMKHYHDSVTKSCPNLCDPMNCSMPSLSPRLCSKSCPSSQCYLTILSFATLFSFCSQSSPASGSFPMSWFLLSGVQSIGASPSPSFLPMNIQGWFPLDWLVWSPCCPRDS